MILDRTGRDGSMTLNGSNKVFGSSQGTLEMLNTEGNIYIGMSVLPHTLCGGGRLIDFTQFLFCSLAIVLVSR